MKSTNGKTLLTAFRGTSAAFLVERLAPETGYRALFLPNDRIRDSELLVNAISNEHFDRVICFGQKPRLRDKVSIEAAARDGEASIHTGVDCEKWKRAFRRNGIDARISHSAGTSFCNRLYWNGLRCAARQGMDTEMLFIHIPFLKNITDPEGFCEMVRKVLEREG